MMIISKELKNCGCEKMMIEIVPPSVFCLSIILRPAVLLTSYLHQISTTITGFVKNVVTQKKKQKNMLRPTDRPTDPYSISRSTLCNFIFIPQKKNRKFLLKKKELIGVVCRLYIYNRIKKRCVRLFFVH